MRPSPANIRPSSIQSIKACKPVIGLVQDAVCLDKILVIAAAVDGTMLTLVLLAISNAPWEDRAGAMMAAILDQPGKTTAAKVTAYLSTIRVRIFRMHPSAVLWAGTRG